MGVRTTEAVLDRRLVTGAMKVPLLDAERERALAVRWREAGDERALHELTSAYMRLAISIAARFRRYGLPMSDLVQEGVVGLMQAAARFEPEREVRFSTYAAWWIRAAIQDYVLRNWSIVRTGTTSAQKSLFFNLRRLRARLGDTGDALTADARDRIAVALKVPAREVEAMASRLSAADRSLNAAPGEDGEWQDLLADDALDPEAATAARRDGDARKRAVARALDRLTPRERLVVSRRRLSEDGVTLEALGRELGVSKERVRQIEVQALERLKISIEADVGDPRDAGLIG
ncbi:MAG TPA: RNA polymerase factor sigma-32 [Caulobacteraceae bacterium]|nr:RNA polymerase factor sigma-32 [Caulobacteraceae bacterium]